MTKLQEYAWSETLSYPEWVELDRRKTWINNLIFCDIDTSYPIYIQKNVELLKEKGLLDQKDTIYH